MIQTYLYSVLLSLAIFLSSYSQISAQQPPKGLESCFNYYDYGKVKVNLSAESPSYESGAKINLKGNIVNKNTFPLVDLILYAQIRRINIKSGVKNAHYLIDRVTIADKINLLPGQSKSLDVKLPIKPQYPNGNYEIQYFVFNKYGFHYDGRPFLEEDNAGVTQFNVIGGKEAEFYFDIDNLVVDGQIRNIKGLTYENRKGTITFDVSMIDNRQSKSPIAATIKFYNFEDSLEDRLVNQRKITIDDTSRPIHIDFNAPEQGAYVMLVQVENPVYTIIKFRFAATLDQSAELRMNDLGVSDFPAKRNGRAWVCFHSPMIEPAPPTEVKLSLLSANKKVLDQVSMTDSFSPEVQAISIPLDKLADGNDFYIEAQFTHPNDINKTRSVRIHYDCSAFDQSLKDFSVIQNNSDPYSLIINGFNACKKNVTSGKINNIRVVQNGKTLKEETNIEKIPYTFSLSGLQAGKYTAQVRIGKQIKETEVLIPEGVTRVAEAQKSNNRIYLVILTALTVLIAVAVLKFTRKKHQ